MEKEQKVKWYDNPGVLTTLIIAIILVIIVCSQSFVVPKNFSLELFESILNHNAVYLLILVYFIVLKFKVGKKYFNYLNVFLSFVYFLSTITSLLTVAQSFSLNTVLIFAENFLFLLYLVHTLFRDTRIWKELNLQYSPFNELGNDWFFYSIIVVGSCLLAVNLISTVVVRGVLISILDYFYLFLFVRYIYLYRQYLDDHQLDSENVGNFDEVREKVQEVLDKTEIDDKIVEIAHSAKEKVNDFVERNDIDEVIDNTAEKIQKATNKAGEKINDMMEKKEEKKKKDTPKKKNEKKGEE